LIADKAEGFELMSMQIVNLMPRYRSFICVKIQFKLMLEFIEDFLKIFK